MSRIDVMVTCYNYGRYLTQCVESLLTQSHGDLRVLILDDASTDETPAVSEALAARDPRVSLRRHTTNLGHNATFNEAIDLACADYLLVLSADDFLLPGALARAAAVLDAEPDVGLVHGAWVAYRDGSTRAIEQLVAGPPKREQGVRLLRRLAENNHIATATAVVRLAEQQRLGHYRIDLPHTSDLEMWVRFALFSQVAYVPQRQAAWRLHDKQMSKGYGPLEDLEQCRAAFQVHEAAIQDLPRGRLVLAQVRSRLALRARRAAASLVRQGETKAGLALCARALGATLQGWTQQLRARLQGG